MPTTATIRHSQLVLPMDELERTFDLDEFRQAFVKNYLTNGNNGLQAVHAANEAVGKKPQTDNGAKKRASLLLREQEVARAIEVRRIHAAKSNMVDEAYVMRGLKLLVEKGLGEAPVRKTVMVPVTVTSDEADSEEAVEQKARLDVEVYDPNLAAAKGALELLGKSIKLFTDKTEHSADAESISAFESLIRPTMGPPSMRESDLNEPGAADHTAE